MPEALRIGSDSTEETLHVTPQSQAWALPVNAAGRNPRRIYIAVDSDTYIKLGIASSALASATVGCLVRASAPMILNTGGYSHLITWGTSAGTVNITPLEN